MFGGYQVLLADPIARLACAKFPPGYDVWAHHRSLDFRLPSLSDLELRFDLPQSLEGKICKELEGKGRSTPTFEYGYYRDDGKLCTVIKCAVAIRSENYLKNWAEAYLLPSQNISPSFRKSSAGM